MKIVKSTRIGYLVIFILCLPLLFFNVKSSHDWGDDFAGYIHQTKNILEGKSQTEIGYIYNPKFPTLAPPSYPSGFPLLLAPVYALFGNSIFHFNLYISLFLVAFSFLIFRFLIRYFSILTSVLLVLIFIYNPWTLSFKLEVMSDFPFSFFLLLAILIYSSEKPLALSRSIQVAVVAGLLISIRNIGVVFILSIFLYPLIEAIIKKQALRKDKLISGSIIFVGGVLIFLLIDKMLLSSSQSLFSYKHYFSLSDLTKLIQTNLEYYFAVMRAFFEPWNAQWQFVAILSGSMIFSLIVLGFLKKIISGFSFIEFFVIVYAGTLIVYPYSNSGFRFLLPLVPFILFYIAEGFKSININLNSKPATISICSALIVLFSYQKSLSDTLSNQKNEIEGPMEKENMEAFEFIKKNLPSDAIIDFIKPRALSLYSEKHSMSHHPRNSSEEIHKNLSEFNVGYILINSKISDVAAKEYLNKYKESYEQIWSNDQNILYKRIALTN